MFKKLLIAAGLFLGSFGSASAIDVNGFTTDYGGSIIERMYYIDLLKKAKVPLEISGVCISACTMYFIMDNVCVQPETIFGFHSASTLNDQDKPIKSKFGNAVLMDHYPENIKKWVIENKALESSELTYMNAETAWSLGIKKCGEDAKG